MLEVLEQTDRVSYYSFLMDLSKHDGINQTVGKLKTTFIIFTAAANLSDPHLKQRFTPAHTRSACTHSPQNRRART